ncbi:MAG TPA: hypothetical protein VJ784_16075 [Pyrinomonadaceae bacterium]|jgi:hypothetical protein|nr:hypothetical protein [Pyrinomonadaceae bacterium]
MDQLSQTNRRLRHSDENSIILNTRKEALALGGLKLMVHVSAVMNDPSKPAFE